MEYAAVSPTIETVVLQRIKESAIQRERTRTMFFAASTVLSVGALIPAVMFALTEISHSAFFTYLALAFTDSGAILASWHQLALALAESAPIGGAILTVGAVFIGLTSLRAFQRHRGALVTLQSRFAL